MDQRKRRENEKKFPEWKDIPAGGRSYVLEVAGLHGWTARSVKEVDADERTIRFAQEIYDHHGRLVEIHEKYPIDTGHRRIESSSP